MPSVSLDTMAIACTPFELLTHVIAQTKARAQVVRLEIDGAPKE
jgi:hypothetical protein